MKRLLIPFLLIWVVSTYAQERKYSTFYYQRATLFEQLPVTSEDIIFLGNSITNGGEWAELLQNPHVKNRGISGDICMGVYDRLNVIVKGKPAKIFLLIGINDVSRGTSVDTIVQNIKMIVLKIKKETPKTILYLQSVLPVNDTYGMFKGHTSRWQDISKINGGLKELAAKEKVQYIDLFSHFVDEPIGKMKLEYTNDGLHLLGKGYLKWIEIIEPYIKEK